jgi:OOP family OmpA-OmpF porin
MLLSIIAFALASDVSVCDVSRPIPIEQLREFFDSCFIPVGTRITVYIEESSPAPIRPGIGFSPNDIAINQNGKDTLDGVSAVLMARKKLQIKVVGYADPGESGDLVGLSFRRAEAAAAYIITKGIDPLRVTTEAGGADNVIDHTNTADGHARNRRVEFVISATEPVK